MKLNYIVNEDDYFVIKLSGYNFKDLDNLFPYPHNEMLVNAMNITCMQLMDKFDAIFAYTQSNEMVLGFMPYADNRERLYNGSVQKLVSLTASFASLSLYKNIVGACCDSKLSKVYGSNCWFEAVLYTLPSESEFIDFLIQCQRNCESNSKLTLGGKHLSEKQLSGLSADEIVVKLITEKSVNWYNKPDVFKYGTLIKKTKRKDAYNCHLITSKYREISTRIGYNCNTTDMLTSEYIGRNADPYIYEVVIQNDRNVETVNYTGTLDIDYDKTMIFNYYKSGISNKSLIEIRLTNNLSAISGYDNDNRLTLKTKVMNRNPDDHTPQYVTILKEFKYGKREHIDNLISEYINKIMEKYEVIYEIMIYISIWKGNKE